MPIRRNNLYNDPALGQAFSNIADIFAPPSGPDLAGYASAGLTNTKKQALQNAISVFTDPATSSDARDRAGVLANLYAPNQSYYSVDQSNATTQRGQDIDAQTSRANNTADNARALETNAADNTRALDQTRMQQTGDTTRTLLAPVGADATRFIPSAIADMYGLPATQSGIIKLSQGETVDTPDGRTLSGAAKPLSDAEVKGAILQNLPEADQRSVAMQGVPVEQVVDPTTGKPRFSTRQDAVASGAEPYAKTTPSELATLQSERDRLPPNDPRRQEYDARIQALGRGQQQGAYDRSNDEELAKLNTEIFNNGKTALADQHTYSTVLAAVSNPNVEQGSLANAKLSLRKYLNSFGVDAGNTGPSEMLNALGNQIALKLRDPSNGAGMPGSMSDSDREFLRSMSVSLGNSPQANDLLAKYYIAVQQRSIDLNSLREKYIADHGRLDEGFRTQMAAYLKNVDPTAGIKNQLTGGNAAAAKNNAAAAAPFGAVEQWDFVNGKLQRIAPTQDGPAVGAVEEGFRFKGGSPSDPNNWERVR